MKRLATLTGEGFESPIFASSGGKVFFVSDFDVDVDGKGNPHGDPYFQPDTSLHYQGSPLDSDVDRFIVVPPAILKGVVPVVLGCKARVTNLETGLFCPAVVGDIGPTRKTGEGSRAVAQALGINPSPIDGGVDLPFILFELWPGVPALIDGRQYQLKPS